MGNKSSKRLLEPDSRLHKELNEFYNSAKDVPPEDLELRTLLYYAVRDQADQLKNLTKKKSSVEVSAAAIQDAAVMLHFLNASLRVQLTAAGVTLEEKVSKEKEEKKGLFGRKGKDKRDDKRPGSVAEFSTATTTLPAPARNSIMTSSNGAMIEDTGPPTPIIRPHNLIMRYNDITLHDEIGRGAFGIVFSGQWQGHKVAIKMLKAEGEQVDERELKNFVNEATLMTRMDPHPNVVLMIGFTIPPSPMCIVMEFIERGPLWGFLTSSAAISHDMKLSFIQGIAEGIKYLHSQGIVHRDLAARNVLLGRDYTPKIADFGMSRELQENDNRTKAETGPLKWMPPESIDQKLYSWASDSWSFGVVCWEVIARKPPYENLDPVQAASRVAYQDLRLPIPEDIHPVVQDIMRQCFEKEPKARPTFDDICNRMLAIAPRRGSSGDALQAVAGPLSSSSGSGSGPMPLPRSSTGSDGGSAPTSPMMSAGRLPTVSHQNPPSGGSSASSMGTPSPGPASPGSSAGPLPSHTPLTSSGGSMPMPPLPMRFASPGRMPMPAVPLRSPAFTSRFPSAGVLPPPPLATPPSDQGHQQPNGYAGGYHQPPPLAQQPAPSHFQPGASSPQRFAPSPQPYQQQQQPTSDPQYYTQQQQQQQQQQAASPVQHPPFQRPAGTTVPPGGQPASRPASSFQYAPPTGAYVATGPSAAAEPPASPPQPHTPPSPPVGAPGGPFPPRAGSLGSMPPPPTHFTSPDGLSRFAPRGPPPVRGASVSPTPPFAQPTTPPSPAPGADDGFGARTGPPFPVRSPAFVPAAPQRTFLSSSSGGMGATRYPAPATEASADASDPVSYQNTPSSQWGSTTQQ